MNLTSYNELSGKIPTRTQLQTFEPIKFIGNLRLYGPPLTGKCQGETSNTTTIGGSKIYKKDADEFWYRTWILDSLRVFGEAVAL